MDIDSLLFTIILVVGFVIHVTISIAQASVDSVRLDRIQNLMTQGMSSALSLDKLHSLPMGPSGALFLVNMITFIVSVFSSFALIVVLVGADWVLFGLVILLSSSLFINVRVISRVIAVTFGENIALRISGVVRIIAWFLNPLLVAGDWLVHRVLRNKSAGDSSQTVPEMVPVEIDLPLDSAGEPLEEHEVRMIRGVVQLDKTIAREIMVPRVDMVVVDKGTSIDRLAEEMVDKGHSRIPIYSDDLDQIEGIANARDVLSQLSDGLGESEVKIADVIRPALFIPESKTLEELLTEFQKMRMHMAIVVDEYGGVSGLVTIEDLLEEIVGEIQDEFDVGSPDVELVASDHFVVDAGVAIDHLNELMSVSLEGDGFDTLGGFVYQRLGKIPSPGDLVDCDGLKIEVVSTVGRRLKRLSVTKTVEETTEQ